MGSNFRKFLLLWSGELVSSIGGGLTSFGLGVYIFNRTGSAAGMALVTLLGFLPGLLLSVPAGVLADRYDRRLLMMIGDGCSALGILYILFAMLRGEASLAQICAGVFISSVFSALLEPSYKATITDLLTKEEFSRASGLVSIAGSARYLFAPVIAGFLLGISDVKLLLAIDICTFFLTVAAAAVVRRGLPCGEPAEREPFLRSLREGWRVITGKRGLPALIVVSALVTLFMGTFQVLAKPFMLSFSDAQTLGITETACACGMLAAALVLGIRGIRKGYAKILGLSLLAAGAAMFCFGLTTGLPVIICSGFLFFAALPAANNCIDYLARTNIPQETQGRAWGLIGFLSQTGYVIAYAVSGVLADAIGNASGAGSGAGPAAVIRAAGILLALAAGSVLMMKHVRGLEKTE